MGDDVEKVKIEGLVFKPYKEKLEGTAEEYDISVEEIVGEMVMNGIDMDIVEWKVK